MYKFSRHELRFMAMMVLVVTNIVVTGIIGMAVNSAIEAGQMPLVPRSFVDGWTWFSIFATPLIALAGTLPAGKDDLLRWPGGFSTRS